MNKLHYLFLSFFMLGWLPGAQAQVTTPETDVPLAPQRNKQGSFHFGLTTALNATWILTSHAAQNSKHYTSKTTLKGSPVGLALGYKFNDHHDLQLESYISYQGQDYKLSAHNNGSGEQIGEKHINLTYLQIPLLYKFSYGDATRFTGQVGPQVGFLLQGEEVNEITRPGGVKTDGSSIPVGTTVLARKTTSESLPVSNNSFNSLDPSIVLGVGLEKDITDNLYLSGNLRLNHSFRNFLKSKNITDVTTGDTYGARYNVLGGVQLGIHYTLNRP